MNEKRLIDAKEVAEQLGVSKAYAYKVIRQLNEELESTGCRVVPGKVNNLFFTQKYFALPSDNGEEACDGCPEG